MEFFYNFLAGDVAVELSHHATDVHLSTERGGHVIPRLYNNGTIPIEGSMSRIVQYVSDKLKRYLSFLFWQKIIMI